MASRLTAKCGLVFSPAKVARKWQTLVDGYKGVKDNNNSTGRGVVRFKFFDQMDSLLGGQHDIEFPVVGDNEGGLMSVGRRCWVQGGQGQQSSASDVSPENCAGTSRAGGTRTPNTRRLRRTRAPANQLVDVIQESEQASQRRHDEILEEMRAQRISFENLMREYLSKQ